MPADETVAMSALGDQIQAMCVASPVEIAGFVIFAQCGSIEYRSPHAREVFVDHLRIATDALDKA